jgi:predicted polyphosphate/ATP-dependent NAD kinase
MKRLGVIVNPVAGMGGPVGLKGTDGVQILKKARQLGAQPQSPKRAEQALHVISRISDKLQVFTCPGEMGENECRNAGFPARVIGTAKKRDTSSKDTKKAARKMLQKKVDLLLFAGGDGTARDIYEVVGEKVTTLGIPAGVKIHSAVYAVTPKYCGLVVTRFLEGHLMGTRVAEVMDIDEEAFRQGVVASKLFGYLRVPDSNTYIQCVKSRGTNTINESLHEIATDVIDQMHADTYFIIGPGSTTRSVMELLGQKNTLLGVDVIRDRKLVANDVNEEQIIRLIQGKKGKIVVTIIGGQGLVFGRGNQQISPRVIREIGRENIIIIATKEKLISLGGRPLLVDTGDQELDELLKGYMRVTTGRGQYVMYKLGL